MKKKKLVKQGITALLLASMLGTTFIPPISTAAEAIQMLADAAPQPGQYASALTYQLTYVNNSGAARKIYSMQQGAYNRNMLRKEYFTGDASDPTFGKYVGKYIWCVANHTHHPPIGAHPSVVATYDASDANRPIKRAGDGTRIDKFNFYVAALYLYYMSKPENRSSLTDKYADVTNYLMAKVAIAAAYEEGALKGEWEFDNMRVNSNLFEIYARDFNPDSVGSTRIYNEIYEKVPAPAELGGGTLDRPIGLLWEMWNNAKTLSELNYDDGGLFGTPVITQGSDGLYHGKVYLTLNNNNSLFLSDLTTEEVYGDWQYKGVGTEDGKAYVEFTSPTGTVPDGGVFAKMKLRPDSSLQAINTDFSKASITQFDFKDKNGAKSGQDMLVADFEGELTVTIKEGGVVPPLPVPEGASVVRYEHEEGFDANYNVNLRKYDSETGKPLENARFDILEAFDDSQLDDTSLDLTEANGYDGSHLGSLISTSWEDGDEISTNYDGDTGLSDSPANLYNWANDNGTQFQRWEGWDYGEGNPSGDSGNDPDSRDNDITADDGLLYTNNTDNTPDKSKPAHYDTKHYEYHKGYCGGHPAPVVEYEELTGEDPPDSEIDAANQAAHDAAWAAWYEEVQKCEQLAEQGGFFHAIEPGVAKAAMEKDRDEFYKDFISLTYDYSAVETNARAGYIVHGTHKDDIPIETRTVTSSELKDYNSGTGIKHQGASSGEEGDTNTAEVMLLDAEGNPVSRDRASVATASSAKRNRTESKETAADFIEDEEIEETEEAEEVPKSPDEVVKRTPSIASPSVVKRVYRNTEKIEDDEDFEEDEDEIATPSSYEDDEEATPSDAEEEIEASKGGLSLSGLVSDLRAGLSEAVSFISEKVSGAVHAVRSAISRAGGLLRDTESFQKSDASVIDPNQKDIVDWTFIVYDHRTESELHFNKRDLDLAAQEAGYDSYGNANGDGTLEGAVYGLFAKSDIAHPDGKTGTVYKQNDLVAIATTDRDGNGSFMAYTETPGRTYDYDAGSVVKRTDINWDGPKNLHTDAGESVGLNQDNEKFVGHDRNNNEISINENGGDHGTYYDRLSSNQGIEDTTTEATSGSYPVSDNLHNNGNYWIGRPLILGDYYIKELSRSEGFELSVYGKDAELSNRTAFENGGASVEGSVTVKDVGVSPDYDGTVFTVTSSAIGDAGYDIYLSNLPENIVPSAMTYKYEKIQKEQTYQKPVYGTRNVKAVPGEKVIISGKPVAAEVGDKVQLPNGTEKTVNAVSQKEQLYMTVKPANLFASTPAVISVPNGAGKTEFIDEANTILAASYKEPTAAAPWRLVPLSGNNQERSQQINDALSDMTAFNAIRLEDIITQGGTDYAVLRYSYIQYGKESESLYDEQHHQVLVKKAVSFDGIDGFVYAAYNEADLTAVTKNASGFVVSASFRAQKPAKDTVSLYEDLSKLKFVDELSPSYWVYAEGEDRLQNDGSVLTESYIDHYETVTENVTVEEKRESAFPTGQIQYNAAKKAWVLHVEKADIPADGEINFHLSYTPDQTDADGMLRPAYEYADKYVKISASPTMVLTDSYIENPTLLYPGQDTVISDADTVNNPVSVLERPIRQRIKVTKDIQTNPDGSYANNTYDYEAVKKATNFRFKAYLKSNLERLYRAEDGTVTWLDRNGNEISYQDMLTSAFPAVGHLDGNKIVKTNVEKIFTKVDHDTSSKLTSINGNNIDADYKDPETANTVAAWKTPYSTVIAPGGIGVIVNSALYSFRGNNTNVAKSDTIRAEQNGGYARILETVEKKVESGADTITVQEYNYEKFFDAIETANVDKWDDQNQTYTSWKPLGNAVNRTEYAVNNAKASDMMRQFAIKWYLDDEVAKLVKNNTQEEDEGKGDETQNNYTEEVYDEALNQALAKAYNYMKPFFAYDLDAIYALPWDSAAGGGADKDTDTLSADTDGTDYFYAASSYLPYGTYVVVEQQPKYVGKDQAAFNDFVNKHYKIDQPKEVSLPALYEDGTNTEAVGTLNKHYIFNAAQPLTEQAKKDNFLIRFGEEWDANGGDQRQYVIRAHNDNGDFEVYKYGLEPDKLAGTINYGGGSYDYRGFQITQEQFDPLKDYYNPLHKVYGKALTKEQGANENSHYLADDGNKGSQTANGETYESDAVEARYQYGSVSEQAGEARNIRFEHEAAETPDNGAGAVYKNVKAVQGIQKAYDGLYASMLVPFSVLEPTDEKQYNASEFAGYADGKYRNTFYSAKLRIEKLDSETHENLLHDGALFMIYKAQRDEKTGYVKFYEEDTTIVGSEEFLKAMNAENIQPLERGGRALGVGEMFSGVVKAGTPICEETDKVVLSDAHGNDVGQFEAFSTINDVSMKDEDTNKAPNEYRRQTTGYLDTPQPLGAGVYVLAEVPPRGYVRTKPIAVEIYSDKVTYYKEGKRDNRVHAAIYEYTPDGAKGNMNKPQDKAALAQIYVENTPIKLQIEKVKPNGDVTFKVGTRVEGSLTEIGGNPDLMYAYSNGQYLGYAYEKGTLERLKAMKDAGEQVEIVYENGQFAGYGYITKTRETDDDANKYVAGAKMTLFDAIELTPSGDTEDHAFEGLQINRNNTGNILEMFVKKGYAGKKTEMVKETDADGKEILTDYVVGYDDKGNPITKQGYTWKEGTVERPDTDILYYDLDSLSVTWTERIDNRDILFGWDKNHQKVAISQIESDKQNHDKSDREPSIYAFKGGQAVFEFVGGDFTKIKYNSTSKILEGNFAQLKFVNKVRKWKMSEGTVVYHLDRNGNRDAMVDPYTGMAYVLEPVLNDKGEHIWDRVLVWPINIAKDEYGNIISRDKITTSRIATVGENQDGYNENVTIDPINQNPGGQEIADAEKPVYSHQESGFINGTWKSDGGEESHKETTLNTNKQGQNMNEDVLLNDNNGDFLKYMNPVYDEHGLVLYYQRSNETYDKGTNLYDRNGDFVRYKDSDNLEEYNKAAYALDEHEALYDGVSDQEVQTQDRLYHRKGESYILENTWMTSDKTPNDPFATKELAGQADLLKRLPAGTYIMEELAVPEGEGYTIALPTGITVEESSVIKSVEVVDDTTKLIIEKTDEPTKDKVDVLDMNRTDKDGNYVKVGESEAEASEYGYAQIAGAKIALYPAKYTIDLSKPEGYRLDKTSNDPFVFETTNSNIAAVEKLTASWTTGAAPIYLEGVPAGYYILEELAVPENQGFVKSEPVYVHVISDREIQSFKMADDHTKIAIWKYKLENGKKATLPGAEFGLYEALLDGNGNVVMKDGVPQYDKTKRIDAFTSNDASDYTDSINLKDYPNTNGKNQISGFTSEFEKMYAEYGVNGKGFSWSVERTATRDNADSNVWVLENGSRVVVGDGNVTFPADMSREDREGFKAAYADMIGKKLTIKWASNLTASVTDVQKIDAADAGGTAQKYPAVATIKISVAETGKVVLVNVRYNGKEFDYSYKFDYTKLSVNNYVNAWLTADGMRRIDYLPSGMKLVLVEEKAPTGFALAKPQVIEVKDITDVQLHDVVNEQNALLITKKSSETGKEFAGNKLVLYRADEAGKLTKTAEYLVEEWTSGEDGTYTENDLINGLIPAGFKEGDLKPHYIYNLADGKYFLTEAQAQDYYKAFEPIEINYAGGQLIQVVEAVNHPVTGKLIVNKTDAEGGKLHGVVFELSAFDKAGNMVEGFPKQITDTNGVVTVSGLPVGAAQADGTFVPYTYKLREITPPTGFAVNNTVYSFQFKNGEEDYTKDPSVEFAVNEIDVKNQKTKFYIEKKDLTKLNDAGTDGAFIDGAVLAIYRVSSITEDGKYTYNPEDLFEQWTSSKKEGKHLLEGLVAGQSYVFVEKKAPAGYTLMKPVLITVSADGRSISEITNNMSIVKVEKVQGSIDNSDTDSIAALTVKGRIIQKTEVAVLDSTGKEVLRFAGTDGEHVIEKTDALKENEVYTFAEHTLYSDGSDVITAKVTRRVHFGENGFVYRGRQAKNLNIQVTDEEGNVLSEFAPTEEKLEQMIDNNLRPENPRVVEKNRNGDAGEPLTKGQPVINTITYYNPSPKEVDVSVEAVLTNGASVLDPYTGTAEENTVRWTIKKVAPYTQGSISFASTVNEDASSVALSVTVKAAGKTFETTKQVPVKQNNFLTVYNELTGSGKDLHQGETSEFTVRLFDERGDELAGSYAYTGSKEGMLRSGDTITLAGNEFITIDPANFRNCTYEVTRADNGLQVTGYDLKGVITEEGSGAWFTRSTADTSERQVFTKGSTYFLTETTAYTDGEARISNKFSFTLNEDASISAVGGYDKETKVSLSKTDFTTGEELPGNHMQIVDKDGNVVEEWISGDKPHEITGLTPGESYTLKETSPKDGYSYAEDIQFTVNEDGTVDSVVMENKPTYIQVSKKDITNDEELPGATLEIIDKNGTVVEKWVSTDKPHEIIGKLIADETYTLRETIAPDGFVIANEIQFTVSHDGSIDYVEMIDDTTKVRIYKNVFAETATPSTPSNADKEQALAGSTLQILNEDKTPFLYHGEELIFTTGESFKLLEKTLVAGKTYWLHEVKPTPGYAYADDVKFTVSLDGSIDIVLMEDKPTDVILSKKAITGEDELPGNKMQLVDQDGNVIEEWTSGDKPHEIKGKLEADKEYRLIEVKSKDGYAYAEDVIFTVNHDGTSNLVEMRDDVTKVEILKVSKGTNKPLAGAEFELLDKSGTVVEKWVSTSEPHKIYGKLIAGETYTLRETKAPSGYKKMADVPVTVNLTADVLTVTAENTKTPGDHGGGSDYTIRLRKVDENGNTLAGAAFKATGEYDGILSITKESGGTVFAIHLKRAQKVMISEISAPNGYHKLEGTYEIEIPSNGDAILLNGDEQFYQDSANSYVFYAVNTQTPPETPPETPEETPPTPEEHPKKGKITAEFDKNLSGIGKFKLNYDGSVVDLTAKTGDDFPIGLLLSVFVGSLLAALGAAFMYFKNRNGNGPKNDPPKGGASGSSPMAIKLPMFLLLAALSVNLYGISAQAAPKDTEKTQEAGAKEDVQYREKTYLSDTDKIEEQKAEFDPSITVDGKTYVLDSVDYEVQSKKKLEDPEANIKIVTSAPFVDEESNHVPEGEMKEGGKSYYLKSYEVVETKLDARTEPVSDTITYSNIPVDSKIPEMAKLSVKDSVTGKNVEVQVPLSDKEFTEPHWISGFEFPITVSNYDAGVFDLNGHEITLSEDAPLKGHENELLNMIGVSAEDYRINSIVWAGGTYTENGVVYRKLKATGEMRVTDCKATYAGVANLPEVDAKAVQAVYSDRRIATASNAARTGTDDDGSTYSYTMKATAKYVTNMEPLKQKSFLDRLIEFITNPVVVAVLLTLLFIVLVIWLVRRKKKKESDKFLYISDDDEEDE